MFRNESHGGDRRRSLVIALAVAAPLCLAGGLAYRATSGSDPASDSSARADTGASVIPWTPGSGTSADGAGALGFAAPDDLIGEAAWWTASSTG
ncbi:MAG TPA: hypothetical protein VGL02_27790, partial [Streptomyces sp.]